MTCAQDTGHTARVARNKAKSKCYEQAKRYRDEYKKQHKNLRIYAACGFQEQDGTISIKVLDQ